MNRIIRFTDDKNIINSSQFGFRSEHSTTHQILRVINHIKTNKTERKSTGLVLFDIEKAFDSVWHDGLIFKMTKFGFPTYITKIIQAFCSNRSYCVHVGDTKSRQIILPAGLPQGSVLSPTLFNVFVSDLRLPKTIQVACYADDTAIFTSANRTETIIGRLQNAIVDLSDYFVKWKIKINPSKTQAVVFPFNQQRKRQPRRNLVIDGSDIEFSQSVKYLGVTLDNKLNFGIHINSICRSISRCIGALFSLIGRRSKLSLLNKRRIFTGILRPIMTYASPVWRDAAATHLKKLQILQNRALKIIFGLHWRHSTIDVHKRAGISMFVDYIDQLFERFVTRGQNSRFEIIRDICSR